MHICRSIKWQYNDTKVFRTHHVGFLLIWWAQSNAIAWILQPGMEAWWCSFMMLVTIMERWKSSSAGSIMSLQRESWSTSHTRNCAPEKLFLKEVSARAWTGVAVSSSQLLVSLGTVFLKMQSGSGRLVLLHTHALNIQRRLKAKICSWNSYLFTTKSEVV